MFILNLVFLFLISIFFFSTSAQARYAFDPIKPKEPISACKFGQKKNLPENIFGTWEGPRKERIIFNRDETTQNPGWSKETAPKIKYRVICNKDGISHLLLGSYNQSLKTIFYQYINIVTFQDAITIWFGPILTEQQFKNLSDKEVFDKILLLTPNKQFANCDNISCLKENSGSGYYGRIISK